MKNPCHRTKFPVIFRFFPVNKTPVIFPVTYRYLFLEFSFSYSLLLGLNFFYKLLHYLFFLPDQIIIFYLNLRLSFSPNPSTFAPYLYESSESSFLSILLNVNLTFTCVYVSHFESKSWFRDENRLVFQIDDQKIGPKRLEIHNMHVFLSKYEFSWISSYKYLWDGKTPVYSCI